MVRIELNVEHVLVMLSPLVWTQGVAGVLAPFGFTRQDTIFYVMTSRGGLPQLIRIYVGHLGQFEFLETPRMNMLLTDPYSSTDCSTK